LIAISGEDCVAFGVNMQKFKAEAGLDLGGLIVAVYFFILALPYG
jgi:hypothetical protein